MKFTTEQIKLIEQNYREGVGICSRMSCEDCPANEDENSDSCVKDLAAAYVAYRIDSGGSSDTGKASAPKSQAGMKKAPMSSASEAVFAEVGVAMLEGNLKYSYRNARIDGASASVYYDATMRHLMRWFSGENIDPDSGLSHLTKAISSLVVLRDAEIHGKMVDDRPSPTPAQFFLDLDEKANALRRKYAKEA
jgi:hypothetical protein